MDVLSKGTATMANANPSRVGQQLGAGDTRALFLKVFSGEVMTVYDANTVMKDKVRVRNISSGKSVQFPAIGRTKASYHTPGTEIVGDIIQQDEKVITIDDLLIADTFISRIDEAMSQFEVRSEYSNRMGQALAQTYDRNLLSLAVKTARDTGVGGTGLLVPLDRVMPSRRALALPRRCSRSLMRSTLRLRCFDQKFIPDEDRFAFVSPAVYWSAGDER
jgi:hypothetical protein